ncbi:MAG: lytic transglycosylase domain-containing protein, partial [Muribaculaceae bacterium]|nr:lytic transglycosylase domain-containing protein [Muribaculaceae bacterium]
MKKTIFLTLALLAGTIGTASAANPNVNDIKTSITDDAVVFPEAFEQDTQKLLEGWYMRNYTATDNSATAKKDVETSDETIKKRLAAMPTVIDMPFNQIVRQYIDRYTKTGRPQVSAILGLSLYYMPIFEQALEERGLPQELKYLPVIESGLDPNAVSKHGATGLWQLMLATGKGLGLDCNSLVDERRDPYASSRAAADLLSQLYDTYGDWSLAIAAYNSGPSAVNKAIRRAGGDPTKADFWSIYPYLSDETRGYVPMFIAVNYVMTYYPQHNISPVLPTKPLVTDTVGVTDRMHFDQIEAVLAIPKEELRILNPQYREDVIPGSPERPYMLVLPAKQLHAYLMSHAP